MRHVPNNSYIGLAQFSYPYKQYTKILHNLTKVDSINTRQRVIDALPKSAMGSTCIKCGVSKAIQVGRNIAQCFLYNIIRYCKWFSENV